MIDRELDRESTGSQLCVYPEVETGVGTLIASIVHSLRPFNMPEIFTDYVAYSGPLDCARRVFACCTFATMGYYGRRN